MEFDLKNQVVVITGGAGLLGFRYAKAIAEQGGIPVLWDIDEKKVKAKAKEIEKTGKKALGFKVDITSEKEIIKSVDDLIKRFNITDLVKEDLQNGWYKYTVGSFTDLNQAKRFRDEFIRRTGHLSAYLVLFQDGIRQTGLRIR